MRCQANPVGLSSHTTLRFLGGTLWLLISSISTTQASWYLFTRQRVDSIPLSWYCKHASPILRQVVTSLPDKAIWEEEKSLMRQEQRRNTVERLFVTTVLLQPIFGNQNLPHLRTLRSDDAFFNSISDASQIASNNNGNSFLERDSFNMGGPMQEQWPVLSYPRLMEWEAPRRHLPLHSKYLWYLAAQAW